ncbi:MAG TPA: Ig-like domain-containing protein [Candidatus Saccharimonadales bacterium]|nr:Ig-like domain-containing protein [Candidatus Saccharimonadales bacterium]
MRKRLFMALITAGSLVGLVLVGSYYYNHSHLLLKGTVPQNGSSKVSSVSPVIFTFNKSIRLSNSDRFVITPAVQGKVTVKNNQLTFTPTLPYTLQTSYSATLKSPQAANGQVGSDVYTRFYVTYVPFSQLPANQQQADLGRTDALERIYPILHKIPYENNHFKITYSVDDANKLHLSVTLYAVINGPSDYDQYQQQLKQYKNEALQYLQNNGADINSTDISFTPNV